MAAPAPPRRVSWPLAALIMHMANNARVMGERRNHALANAVGWATAAVMFAAAAGLVLTWSAA
jgi:Mn2+/Fe2+ NRAMP family transporter